MFPHPCGEQFERAVAGGADPKVVVPDTFVIVRGGTKLVPPTGDTFSCTAGPTLGAAACAVPYNQVRATTAGAIRAAGGVVEWVPELSPRGTMSPQHVHVTESAPTVLGDPQPNPVPKSGRIDGGK
ncbi:MAG TPA: hypothetical protein VFG68_22145 [Fimbriiglobus sp.]|nr:hypothetical protein [Fimbriiglobus sp.]